LIDVGKALASTVERLAALRLRIDTVFSRRADKALESSVTLNVPIAELDEMARLAAGQLATLGHRGRPAGELARIELLVAVQRGELAAIELKRRE
jgi:hypothetical protein